jgi:hypothetical protein
MQPPSLENLFMAGGVIFFFDNGAGERDLGLIEEPPDVESKATEIKVFSSRSGKRRLAKTFTTEDEVIWTMKLQEAVMANMQAFFKGGPIEVIGAGTGTITDQLVTLSGEKLVSLGKYGISAVTVTNLAGDVTYVHNVDYIIDPGQVAGGLIVARIGRIAAGAITNGQQVKVDFTYTTWSALRFAVANDQYQQGAGRIQFRPLKGYQWNLIIPKCQLKPNGKMVIDDKKVVEVPIILEVLDATAIDPDHPFGYWECLNES